LKRLLKCLREYKAPTFITFLFMIGEAFMECQIPTLTADLVNNIKAFSGLTGDAAKDALTGVLETGLKLILMACVSLCCGGAAGYTCSKAAAGFAKNLRHDVYAKVQDFSFGNVDKFSSSSLVTRLTTDIANIQFAYMNFIRSAIRCPLMVIFSIVMAYRMAGSLAMTFVFIIPVLVIGLAIVIRIATPAFRRVFKKYDILNESIEENIRGMRVVKGFAREKYEKQKFDASAENIRKDFTFAERVVALNNPLMQICVNFNLVFIMYVGAKIILRDNGITKSFGGEITIGVGQLSAMLTYAFQILMSLMFLSLIFVILTMSAESINRISEVLKEESTLTNPENPVYEIPDGSVDFENVAFKYSEKSDRYSLSSTTFHIPTGATVGILGGTGVGKSTLVQLIPRLYDTTEGTVKVGGRDVKEYDLASLRDAVAMVLQKNVIFSGTIKDNLRWGNPNATDEEMIEACKLAQADEFISTFPDGYNTKIEQGGTNVSGGQKQRLCIARALLKKPKILILDDSTSAVDTKTDALIREGFRSFIPETTKIIIAQRISSVQDADMIIVMENGAVVDIGTHEELLARSEIYREVHLQQTVSGGEENA
jgi:ATP-binding cassette, subfamily B, multidrug efflux pump